jgi:iron complex outermembrane receptor protein
MSLQSETVYGPLPGQRVSGFVFSVLCASASAVLLGATSVFAADADEAGAGLQEITVTARRVSESVQAVPIAITAFSGDKLRELGATDLNGLQNEIPGITLCCNVFNSASVSIRGVASQNSLFGATTYFNDVPVTSMGYGNYFDVNHFEVLKGPQGTLFGQASVAGAFVFEPNKPGDKLGGYISASAGDYQKRSIEGAVDLPLIDDHLYVRLAAISNYRQGYIHDLSINKYYGDQDYYILRPSIRWKITDSLENLTMFQYARAQDSGNGAGMWVLSDISPNIGAASAGGLITAINGGTPAAYYNLAWQMLALQERLGPYNIVGTNSGCSSGALGPVPIANGFGNPVTSLQPPGTACPYDEYWDQLLINTTTWTINDNWSVKNIFGYDKSRHFNQNLDGDLTPLILLDFLSPLQNYAAAGPRIWSDEVQAHGKAGRFDFTFGTFHSGLIQDGTNYGDFDTVPSLTGQTSSFFSHAVYGQTNIHSDFGLSATLGVRYNIDYIKENVTGFNPFTGASLGTVVDANSPTGHAEFHNVSYTAGLQYQLTPDTMIFSTLSKGYSAGGFQANAAPGPYFKPETLTNLETGIKSTFEIGGVQARVNASYYYGKFKDAQVGTFQSYTTAGGTTAVGFITSNAANALVRGFETEITVLPVKDLQLGAWFAYNNNVYTSFDGGINPADPTGPHLDYSSTAFLSDPHEKVGASARYRLPLGLLGISDKNGDVTLTANYTHQSDQIDTSAPASALICTRRRTVANGYPAGLADGSLQYIQCREPYQNLDVSARWDDVLGHEGLSLVYTMTNVTKNTITDSIAQLESITGFTAHQPAVPRMWYVTLTYKF